MQTAIQLAAFVVAIIASVHLYIVKNDNRKLQLMILDQVETNQEVKNTLLFGLYHRFKKAGQEEGSEEESALFIKGNPHTFEEFMANIYKDVYGGEVYVTKGSGDFGVDIEHRRDGKLYYIQVKCYKKNLPFDPIALVHSNMKKYNADGGIVITTSDFTKNAKWYAKNLDVELVNGMELVELWVKSLNVKRNEINGLKPEVE